MSKSRDYADLKQDLDNAAFTGLYSDLDGLPTIPTTLSQLTNDAGYITTSAAAPVDSVNGQTGVVSLSFDDLSDVTTSAAGTNKFLTKTGSTYLFTGLEYSDLSGLPTIPSSTSQLTNNSDYATNSYVDSELASLVNSSPAALDTLNELAAAIGDDANFSTTITNSIATKASQTDLDAVEADVTTLQSEMVTRTSFDTLMLTAVNGNTTNNQTNTNKITALEAKTSLSDFTNDTTPSISDAASTGTALTIFSTKQAKFHSDLEVLGSLYISGTVDGVDIAARNSNLTTAESNISALQAKTNLTDFTNDISEVTSTEPTSGTGKPAGYVWYIV